MLLLGLGVVVVAARPEWNPVGQAFYASFLASAIAYLVFAGWYTAFAGLSPTGALASGALFLLELFALTLAGWYSFDGIDAVCRVRCDRPITPPDPSYRPKVCL